MNRRTYLGGCAGVGLAGLAGCLDAVGGRVARTEAVPAIVRWGGGDCDDGDVCVRPHLVRALDEDRLGADGRLPVLSPGETRTVTRNAAGEEPCPDDRCGPGGVVLEAAGKSRLDGTGTDHGWAGLFVVSVDAPLVHDRQLVREIAG